MRGHLLHGQKQCSPATDAGDQELATTGFGGCETGILSGLLLIGGGPGLQEPSGPQGC